MYLSWLCPSHTGGGELNGMGEMSREIGGVGSKGVVQCMLYVKFSILVLQNWKKVFQNFLSMVV